MSEATKNEVTAEVQNASAAPAMTPETHAELTQQMNYWGGRIADEFKASAGSQTVHMLKAGEAAHQYLLVRVVKMKHPRRDTIDSAKQKYLEQTGEMCPYTISDLVACYWSFRLLAEPTVDADGLVLESEWIQISDRGLPLSGFKDQLRRLIVRVEDGTESWTWADKAKNKMIRCREIWTKFLTDVPRWPVSAMDSVIDTDIMGLTPSEKQAPKGKGKDEPKDKDDGKGEGEGESGGEGAAGMTEGKFNDLLDHCGAIAKQVGPADAALLAYAIIAGNSKPDETFAQLMKQCDKAPDLKQKKSHRAVQAARLVLTNGHKPINRVAEQLAENNGQLAEVA